MNTEKMGFMSGMKKSKKKANMIAIDVDVLEGYIVMVQI